MTNLCVHDVPELQGVQLPGFRIMAHTQRPDELLAALSALNVQVLILNLDRSDSLTVLTAAREARPGVGVVGVTSGADPNQLVLAHRAGCEQVTLRPVQPDDLLDALQRTGTPLSCAVPGKVFALLGAIGGAGVTTLACHLAVELAAITSEPVGLADLDFDFGGVSRLFDLDAVHTIADICEAASLDPDVVQKAGIKLPSGVCVHARPHDLLQAHALSERAVMDAVRAISTAYPHVVLDLPRKLDAIVGDAIESATRLILVVQLTVPSVFNTKRLLEALRGGGVPLDKVDILVNRFRKGVHAFSVEDVQRELGRPVIGAVPSDYEAVRLANDTGQPLNERCPVRSAIAEIASRLVGAAAPKPSSNSGGWLRALTLGVGGR